MATNVWLQTPNRPEWRAHFGDCRMMRNLRDGRDHHLLRGIDAEDLEYVPRDIQTDRGNLHPDGSAHVIRYDDHSMALRCRERAPSTTSIADETAYTTGVAG